jgi:TonB family protein
MKKILVIMLLLMSTACWSQTTAIVKSDSTKVTTFRVTKKNDTTKAIPEVENHAPYFSGGDKAYIDFFEENLQYPHAAAKKKIKGEVIVSFDVDTDGALSNIKIVKDIGGGCGAEAVRVVKLMPNLIPGIKNGKPVTVKYKLPVTFPPNSFYK